MAMHARSHSSDCAGDEQSQIIRTLRDRDAARAVGLMERHLGAVAARAAFDKTPDTVASIPSRYGRQLTH